jgi:hypothetical protein
MSEEPAAEPSEPAAVTEAPTSKLRISTSTAAPLVWAALLLALAGGGVIASMLAFGMLQFTPGPDTPAGKTLIMQEQAAANSQLGQEVDSAIYRVSWNDAKAKLTSAQQSCDALDAALPKLQQEIIRLLTGDAGRRIASSVDWVDQFIVVRDRKRLTEDHVAAQRTAIEALLQQCENALNNPKINIEFKSASQLALIHDDLAQAEREVAEDLRHLQALAAESQSAAAAEVTLAAAIEKRELELSTASLAELTAAQAAQREAATRRRQETVLEADRQVQAAELAREQSTQQGRIASAEAETEKQRQAVARAAERAAAEAAHRKKVAAFEREFPAMKLLLAPFISRGKLQLQGASWVGGEEGPVSLAAIEQSGALSPTSGTSYMLMYFGNGVNGRPAGSFPRGHANDQGEVRQVQDFLIEYGDILVEKKLLRP